MDETLVLTRDWLESFHEYVVFVAELLRLVLSVGSKFVIVTVYVV